MNTNQSIQLTNRLFAKVYTKVFGTTFAFLLASLPCVSVAQTLTGSSLDLTDGTPDINLIDNQSTIQRWRVFGSSARFAIEDKTNFPATGDNIFSLEPNARNNAIYLDSNDYLGLGTSSPEAYLDVRDNSLLNWVKLNPGATSGASLEISETSKSADIVLESVGTARWQIKTNAATGRLTFKDLNGTTTPFKFGPEAAENLLRVGILAKDTVDINGDLVVTGNCTEQNGACADYVFEPGYKLRSLDELAQYVSLNRHLPNVPSADQMKTNGVNIAHLSGRLLEKIEELTLYTLHQEETLQRQEKTIQELQQRLTKLEFQE